MVVEHQDYGVEVVLGGGGEFLEVVLEAAVAGDADYGALGLAGFGAEAGGEGEAEAGPAVGVHEGAGVVDGQTTAGAAGGDGGVEGKDGFAGGGFADGLEYPQFVGPGLLQDAVDVLADGGDFVEVGLAFAYVAGADGVEPLPGYGLGVGGDGDGGGVVFADGVAVEQDVD